MFRVGVESRQYRHLVFFFEHQRTATDQRCRGFLEGLSVLGGIERRARHQDARRSFRMGGWKVEVAEKLIDDLGVDGAAVVAVHYSVGGVVEREITCER
jgi:hypothetical protein